MASPNRLETELGLVTCCLSLGRYPDNLAWYMKISKKALKRTPALEK